MGILPTEHMKAPVGLMSHLVVTKQRTSVEERGGSVTICASTNPSVAETTEADTNAGHAYPDNNDSIAPMLTTTPNEVADEVCFCILQMVF